MKQISKVAAALTVMAALVTSAYAQAPADQKGMSGMEGQKGMAGMSGMQGQKGMSGMEGQKGMSGMEGKK